MTMRGAIPERAENQQVWLFQASVPHYDLGQSLATVQPGHGGKWNVRQNRDLMQPGQPVLLWNSGPNAGVYGVGHLTGTPQFGEIPGADWPSEWWVDWQLDGVLEPAITRESLKSHPVLSQMHIMRVPRGTNFKLSAEEWNAFVTLMQHEEQG